MIILGDWDCGNPEKVGRVLSDAVVLWDGRQRELEQQDLAGSAGVNTQVGVTGCIANAGFIVETRVEETSVIMLVMCNVALG